MRILLGVPHTGTLTWGAAQAVWRCSEKHKVEVVGMPTSLPTCAFNTVLADALNRNEDGGQIDAAALLHADLAPQGFWIDKLAEIMQERDADFVSVINAIKDNRGLTSSGLGLPGHRWNPARRFTMKELVRMPMTFSAESIGFPSFVLLHNSGCWLADVRKPVFRETNQRGELRVFFDLGNRIKRRQGKWVADIEPEDWFLSRRLHEVGAKTFATREVVTLHTGTIDYDNATERGPSFNDEDLLRVWGQVFSEEATC